MAATSRPNKFELPVHMTPLTSFSGDPSQYPLPNVGPTIYLSGPMTGYPDFNAATFAKYAKKYRELGFNVISPPEMDRGDYSKPYETYIRRDVRVLLADNVERMYLLPGWQASRGAKLEKHLAEVFKIAIYDAETGELWHESVAQEAQRIVKGERRGDYGHPFEDFGRTSGMLNALLKHKLISDLTQEDVALIMMCVKLSRLANSPDHRDSLVDIPGYALTYEMIRERRKELECKIVNGPPLLLSVGTVEKPKS